MALNIDVAYVIDLLMHLVRINSINPSLAPDGPGEGDVVAYCAEAMEKLGLIVTVDELAPKRYNVTGILKGSGGGQTLLLNAHLDTVGVDGMADPFSGEIRGGKLYGRGSQDMKSSMAAMIAAAKTIVDAHITLKGDLIITGVADEEYGSIGTEALVKAVKADAAIVTEPTDLKLCRAHRGFIWFEVETIGRAAHGSRYDLGIDAIMHMGRFLAALDGLEQELRTRPPHPLVGPPSLHTSTILGGNEPSIYPDHCRLFIERRTTTGETIEQAAAEIQALIDKLAGQDVLFKATLKTGFDRAAYDISADVPISRTVEQVITDHLGTAPEHIGQPFWTDAALIAEAGIDTVILGPIGAGLHSREEWVDVQSVLDLTSILARTAVDFCQADESA